MLFSKPLTRLSLLNNQLTKPFSTTCLKNEKNVTIFGAGLMGAGIAQSVAYNGYRVTLSDVTSNALDNGKGIILKSLNRLAKKHHPNSDSDQQAYVNKTMANITLTTDPIKAVKEADIIIEAIIENVKMKQDLFDMIHQSSKINAILTTNTSSLSVSDICSKLPQNRKENFMGLHFFNPVPQMALVEVIKTPLTKVETKDKIVEFVNSLKKKPVSCEDTPGFIVNRLLVPYLLEAIRLIERGDASIEDVDSAMMLGGGHPMGPFQLADFIGLDTLQHILKGWKKKAGGISGINPSLVDDIPLLDELVKDGKLGRKSGQGFYDYT